MRNVVYTSWRSDENLERSCKSVRRVVTTKEKISLVEVRRNEGKRDEHRRLWTMGLVSEARQFLLIWISNLHGDGLQQEQIQIL